MAELSARAVEAEAMTRVLATPEGAEMYKQIKNARVAEQFPGSIRKFKENVAAHVVRNETSWESAVRAVAKADPSLTRGPDWAGMEQVEGMPC
jgi:hypothetical protein